jgi:hypothetical protein
VGNFNDMTLSSRICRLDDPLGIAVSGSDLFVINFAGDTIGEYTIAGATVNLGAGRSGGHCNSWLCSP